MSQYLEFLRYAKRVLTHEPSHIVVQFTGKQLQESYQQLQACGQEIWPSVLTRLGKSAEWKCIAYLVLGPDLEKIGARKKLSGKMIICLCSAVILLVAQTLHRALLFLLFPTVFDLLQLFPSFASECSTAPSILL